MEKSLGITNLPMLQGVSLLEMTTLCKQLSNHEHKFAEGDYVILQDETCNGLLSIIEGDFSIETTYFGGRFCMVEFISAPYTIEPDVLYGIQRRYQSSYRAQSPCRVLECPKNIVSELMSSNVVFQLNFLNLLSTLASRRRQAFPSSPTPSLEGKLAQFFFRLSTIPKGRKELHTRMSDLALFLGYSRPLVSESLHRMQVQGFLNMRRGRIEIPDIESLMNNTFV